MAARTVFPVRGIGFVAAHVNDRRVREDVEQFREHLFQERDGFRVPETEFSARRGGVAGILRTGFQKSARMAGNIDLRNDPDPVPRGEFRHAAEFVFRILPRGERRGIGFGRDRIRGDPPALVVGQVPVEGVQTEMRHQADDGLDRRRTLEMSCAVEHESAPCKARSVRDCAAREHGGRRTADFRGEQHLRKGGKRVRHPRAPRAFRQNRGGFDADAPFIRSERVVPPEHKIRIRIGRNGKADAENGGKPDKLLCDAGEFRIRMERFQICKCHGSLLFHDGNRGGNENVERMLGFHGCFLPPLQGCQGIIPFFPDKSIRETGFPGILPRPEADGTVSGSARFRIFA